MTGFCIWPQAGRRHGGLALLLAFATAARAAAPAVSTVPLVEQPTVTGTAPAAALVAAQTAQELGLPTIAIRLYQELWQQPGADRTTLMLPLVTALLDGGQAAEAEQLLNTAPGPLRGPAWRLRVGLAAAQQKKYGIAREQVNAINVDELTRPDRAWFWFLEGVLADTAAPRDVPKANEFYILAQREAPSDFARATFLIAGERVRLRNVTYTAAEVELARKNYEAHQDSSLGYRSAEDYAVMRDATGGKGDAVRFLSDVLVRIPRAEREATDRFRLLLGMIGDRSRTGAGRNALNQLLETGTLVDLQREALQILAQASPNEPERGLFRAELDKLIAASAKPALMDSVLLLRAQLALADTPKDYATAERRANELKDKYPGSALRPHAFAVLANSAWEQRRYRLAADDARQAREALAALPAAKSATEVRVIGQAIAELRVLEAEAYFHAGLLANSASDFRNAADAYAAALRDPPASIKAGDLIFQQALAEIRADANDPARDLTKVIDTLEADPRFDAANRWEAEWTLARALKVQGKTEEALNRVTRLLAPGGGGAVIAPDLRARMAWLQARLSFDANHPDLTLKLVPALTALTGGLDAALTNEITSTSTLLEAEAQLRLGDEPAAKQTLGRLRAQFPKTNAAIYSYLKEAEYYAEPGRDKIQDAQTTLQKLIDNPEYRDSEYVDYARFQRALLFERLGQEKDLRDANREIENLFPPNRPSDPPAALIFAARLKQGDLLRTLNDFPSAERAYEYLVNDPRFAQRSDVVVAQLRLAECLNAQSSLDATGSNADRAQSMFEELLYRVDAPWDVRAEAGYNLGKLLERRGLPDKARDVWWTDVITPFLVKAPSPIPAGATRSYWLARTLLDLGDLLERREAIDDARRIYVLLRDSKLGYGESIAIDHLQRLGVANAATAAAKS